MKRILELFGSLFILYIVGMIVYGGIKDGYAGQTILIIVTIILLIYLFSLREDNRAKMEQQKFEKAMRKKFEEQLEKFKYQVYSYAYNNERISRIIYDIEEGGQYVTEYDENIKDKIDNIIQLYIKYPISNFEQFLPKIQESILELPKQSKNKYVGF